MRKKKLLILLPLVAALSSCGYRVREVFNPDTYNSSDFSQNFYKVYDPVIDPNNQNNSIKEIKEYDLSEDKYRVVTDYEAAYQYGYTSYHGKDGTESQLSYSLDFKPNDEYKGKSFGPTYKMGGIDESFKYGYISKLFDGQMFCHGGFELVRVQGDEDGFGRLFQKELTTMGENTFFALNLKGAVNGVGERRDDIPPHLSKVNLHVSFYLKDGNDYTQIRTSYIIDVPTNRPEVYDASCYSFFAFSLSYTYIEDGQMKVAKNIDISRCKGFSITYDLIEDPTLVDPTLVHSLLYYEMMIVNCSWR